MVQTLDHVCILVKDIDQAIEHYRNILSVCAPEVLKQKIEKYEAFAGEDRYVSALFPAGGEGCNIQLMQPLNPESRLYQRLQKYGEHIHHLGFTSRQLEKTLKGLKARKVALRSEELIFDVNHPELRWNWITPQYAHGALIEVMDELVRPEK